MNEGGFPLTVASLLARSCLLEANNSKTCDSALRLSFQRFSIIAQALLVQTWIWATSCLQILTPP